ncbi:MAG TPA: TetR/AcrR family transcriptional regulator [Mobilitalea sp.]|nr:TetR/AcrR family transcriptional regulator [Mobilitalea sp.]
MELKDRIIDAVIEEFNEKGLKFTMDDIARRLGISKRTLYTVVQDKEALFIEAVDGVFGAIKEAEKEIIEDDTLDIVDKLKKILIALPKKYQTIDFRQLYNLKMKFPRIYAKIENRLETEWEPTFQIMEQAMKEGRIRKISFPVFKAIFTGTIEYYISRKALIESNIAYEEALQQMLDILFQGICI